MTLSELEFELPAGQYAAMDYPQLKQGQPLSLVLDGGILLPDPDAAFWFAVQEEPLVKHLARFGPAQYAFAGQIVDAEIEYGQEQVAYLSVDCGIAHLRVTCAPTEDGMLPYGTWETRHIAGVAPLQGMVEDTFAIGVGHNVDVTIWSLRRLILSPGDPNFGQWHESVELPSSPYRHDRVYVTGRVHRREV